MNIVLFVLTLIGTLTYVVRGYVPYQTPFNLYGATAQAKPHYPEALVTYGSPQPQRPLIHHATQRGHFYPFPQQRQYLPAQPRAYAPAQPRAYTSAARQRTYAPPQTRAYNYGQPRTYPPAQQRSYPAPHPQPYAPVHPQAYSQINPHPVYGLAQPRTYTHPATTTVYGQRPSPAYFIPAKPTALKPVVRQPVRAAMRQPVNAGLRQSINGGFRQPMNAGIRQPIRPGVLQPMRPVARQPISAFVRQPIRNSQTPLTRTLSPKIPSLYRTGNYPMAQIPQNYAARPAVPLGLGPYGRNHIPKVPARNNIPGKPTPAISRPMPNYRSNKRNNIALNRQINPQPPRKTQTTRNYINGITIPEKMLANINKHGPIKPQIKLPTPVNSQLLVEPIKPQLPNSPPVGHKLSTFLKTVKNLQDTLKGNTSKEGLIYYNDDVSNKSRHRPTNFAPPTRKLGSMGSPGGSRVTFNEEPVIQSAIIPETKAVNQAGSERVKIAQADKKVAKNITPDDGKPTKESNQGETKQAVDLTGPEKPMTKKTAGIKKSLSGNTAGATQPPTLNSTDSTKSPHFATAQVDLGLLKDKVLHSNNSKFLKRVLQVLRKYTKLMKSSMAEKNGTTGDKKGILVRNVLNASMTENLAKIQNTTNAEKIEEIRKFNEPNTEDFSNALNSTKTAVKMFDLLNSASKQNLKSSLVKELSGDSMIKNSTSVQENSSKKSETETKAANLTSSNSETEKSFKDENASKKETIGHNLGKPAFNLDKLKYGLERGNTID